MRPAKESDAREFPSTVTMSDNQVEFIFILYLFISASYYPSYPAPRKSFMRKESFSVWGQRLGGISSSKISYLSMNCQVCVIHVGVKHLSIDGSQLMKRYKEVLVIVCDPRLRL